MVLNRRGRTPVTSVFTREDAVRASLWEKAGPWKTYPKRQMLWRARTFAARDLFPDALKGLVSVEDVMDFDVPTIDSNFRKPEPPAARPEELQKRPAPIEEPDIDPSLEEHAEPSEPFPAGWFDSDRAPSPAPAQPQAQTGTAGGPTITEQQAKKFWAVAMDTHGDHRQIMNYLRDSLGVSNKALIPASRWADALAWAEGR